MTLPAMAPTAMPAGTEVLEMLGRVFQLLWVNKRIEALWLLVHDGPPTTERMSSSTLATMSTDPATMRLRRAQAW